MELKRVSFKVAKAIKEAGYPQDSLPFYDNSGDIWEDDIKDNFYFPCFAPTYMEVWLWLWREKKIPIECVKNWTTTNNWYFNIVDLVKLTDTTDIESSDYSLYSDPEEVIIKAIEFLVDNDLIKLI